MEYLKTDIWNNITAYPHCCIGEGIHSVCVYIEDGKKVIGVPRKAIYNRLGLNINNGSYDTFTLDMDINYEKAHNNHVGNDIVIKDEETRKALLQLGQNIYDFQERFIAVFFKDWSDTLNAVKKTDNQGFPGNCNPYYKEFRCSIEKDDNTNRYVLSGVKGTPLMYFNNKSNAEQFLSILRNVVNVIIDYYRTL